MGGVMINTSTQPIGIICRIRYSTITPSSPDLVTVTIKTCNVEKASSSVSLIDAGLDPVCALGVAIANGQDTSNLSFSWSSFKWNTATVGAAGDESQSLKCTI